MGGQGSDDPAVEDEGAGTSPRTAARLELARAAFGAFAAPFHYLAHVTRRGRVLREIREDVERAEGRVDDPPELELPKDRPLRIFIGAAESSGEIHAANLVRRLRELARSSGAPEPDCTAIGGERLRALDVPTIADPVARAHTGFDGVLSALPYYIGVIEDAARHARATSPDVFVPVDSPALNVPLARAVHRYGVPTCHLVAPQYWGWAPWRVGPYRRAIDLALTILPHEPAWYARHGVRTRHVGHPLLDELRGVPVSTTAEDSRTLAILPGSRRGVIERNLPWMLDALGPLRERVRDLDVAILQSTDEHEELVAGLASGSGARVSIGDLHGELAGARAALAVSGTVLTDVLYHQLPTVVVYRVAGRRDIWGYRHVLTTPYFASTNLLAGREVVPEHCFRGEGPRALVAEQIADAFDDEGFRGRQREGFARAIERLGPAGAIERAAAHVLRVATGALDG
ncbi:MAG: hypothetical protein AAF726_06905 [Planctomycetota bacterium]